MSVGVPKHSPRSPVQILVLFLIPPEQELEQELNAPQELHFLRLPLVQIVVELHSSVSTVSPAQVITLRGTPFNVTLLAAVFREEQLLLLDLFPFPQLAEQELQLLHLLHLSSSSQASDLQVSD